MFPCGHVYYSLQSIPDSTASQIVGSLLPDLGLTGAISWKDLHEYQGIEDLEANLEMSDEFSALLRGVRHHVELDDRSHNSWLDGGGYAYDKQTTELRTAVESACGVDGELARGLAHNFIESALDIHIAAAEPSLAYRVKKAISAYDYSSISKVLASWKDQDLATTAKAVESYFDVWLRHDLTTKSGMVSLWAEILALLNETTFNRPDGPALNRENAADAIDLALDITKTDFMEVLTPAL